METTQQESVSAKDIVAKIDLPVFQESLALVLSGCDELQRELLIILMARAVQYGALQELKEMPKIVTKILDNASKS